MKISIVYESMLGNTHHVAQAIADGVRETHPDADVQCLLVGVALPEQVESTDCWWSASSHPRRGVRLQPQAGSQRRRESGGRREAGARRRMLKDLVYGNGSTVSLSSETRAGPPPSTPASERRWPVARPAQLPVGCASTSMRWRGTRGLHRGRLLRTAARGRD